jgi:hypothetical protein
LKAHRGRDAIAVTLYASSSTVEVDTLGVQGAIPANAVKIYQNGQVISPANGVAVFNYTAWSGGVTLAINASTGAMTFTGTLQTQAYWQIDTEYQGMTYTNLYTLSRARQGDKGAKGDASYSYFTGAVYQSGPLTADSQGVLIGPQAATGGYNFSTLTLTVPYAGTGSTSGGWTAVLPAVTLAGVYVSYCTFRTVAPTANLEVAATSWSTPKLLTRVGDSAVTYKTLIAYTAAPALPPTPTTDTGSYNFFTKAMAVPTGGTYSGAVALQYPDLGAVTPVWLSTQPTLSTLPIYETTCVVNTLLPDKNEAVAAGAWSAPIKIAQLGDVGTSYYTAKVWQLAVDAPTRPSNLVTLTYNTKILNNLPTDWSTIQPASSATKSTWSSTYTYTTNDITGMTPTAGGIWSTPVVEARLGPEGLTYKPVKLWYQGAYLESLSLNQVLTYNFHTRTLSNTGGLSTTMPAAIEAYPTWSAVYTFATRDPLADVDVASYSWTPFQIESQKGPTGLTGNTYRTIKLWQKSATVPTLPATNVFYNFSSGALSNTGAWSVVQPASSETIPTYSSVCTFVTNTPLVSADTAGNGWSSPIVEAKLGPRGLTYYTAKMWKKASSAPLAPTGAVYDFSTNTLTPPTGWLATQPATTADQVTYSTTYIFMTTDVASPVTSLAWSTPIAEAIAGTQGYTNYTAKLWKQSATVITAAPANTATYNFSTGVLTPSSGWLAAQPASSLTLGTYSAVYTFVSATPTVNVETASGTWSTPILESKLGATGKTYYTAKVWQQSATAITAAPAATTTYNFFTGLLTPSAGWLTSQPISSLTLGTYSSVYTFASATPDVDATTASGTWSTPILESKLGATGKTYYTAKVWQQSATAITAAPAATTTYNFFTGLLTPSAGWLTSQPISSLTLGTYSSVYTFASVTPGVDAATASGTWSTPILESKLGATGPAGTAHKAITLWQKSATAITVAPTPATVSYNFSTNVVTVTSGGWLTSQPASEIAQPTYSTTCTFTTTEPTANVAATSGTWSTPVVAAQLGSKGTTYYTAKAWLVAAATPVPSALTASVTCNFVTKALAGLGSWTATQPATSSTTPTWSSTYTFATEDPTSTALVAGGAWSTPIVEGLPGGKGDKGTSYYALKLWQKGATAPTLPTSTTTYNFVTKAAGTLGSWLTVQPDASTTPLWSTTYTFATEDPTISANIASGTWPACVAEVMLVKGDSTIRAYISQAAGVTPVAATSTTALAMPASGIYTWLAAAPASATGYVIWQVDGIANSAGAVAWGSPYAIGYSVTTLGSLTSLTGRIASAAWGTTTAMAAMNTNSAGASDTHEFRTYYNGSLVTAMGDGQVAAISDTPLVAVTGRLKSEPVHYSNLKNTPYASRFLMGNYVMAPGFMTSALLNSTAGCEGYRFNTEDEHLAATIGFAKRVGAGAGTAEVVAGGHFLAKVAGTETSRVQAYLAADFSTLTTANIAANIPHGSSTDAYAALAGKRFGGWFTNGTTSAVMLASGGEAITATGTVTVTGNTKVTGTLTVVGSITTSGNVTGYDGSDIRWKENVVPIANALEKISKISGNTMRWTDEYYDAQDPLYFKREDVSVIAQEIREVLPEAVMEQEDGYLRVAYPKLIPLLIEGIKQLQIEIEELRNGITSKSG